MKDCQDRRASLQLATVAWSITSGQAIVRFPCVVVAGDGGQEKRWW